ncbi:MAG: endo alpha-1,4 polygalactosaminidase [bacterium]
MRAAWLWLAGLAGCADAPIEAAGDAARGQAGDARRPMGRGRCPAGQRRRRPGRRSSGRGRQRDGRWPSCRRAPRRRAPPDALPADALPGCGGAPPDAGTPDAPWRPGPGTSWQIQLGGDAIDTRPDVVMYDVDLFDTPDATLAALRAAGRVVVCYFSAGSHEDWRDDADAFPAAAIGARLDEWPGERWLDVRSPAVRERMRARLDHAVARGCDAVDPDNVDGFTNTTGFPLTRADQLDFNRFLAREAHARGLSVGLKNALDLIPALVGDFDWALNEECFAYEECDTLAPFIQAGKAVFQIEYVDGEVPPGPQTCVEARRLGFSTLFKRYDLDAWRQPCE